MRRAPALRAALVLVLLLAACVEKRDEALSPAGPGVAFAELPFEKALERVRSGGGLVMVNVHAEWCGWCRKLEKEVYSSPRAGAATRGLVAISVDGEVGEGMKIASRYGVRGFPTIFFVDSRGELVQRIDGYVPLDEFLKTVASLPRGVH